LSFVKTKIITNENDKVGVILYGCDRQYTQANGNQAANENSLNFKNIHVMYPLDAPDATLIKQLETKISTFTQDHGWFQVESGQNVNGPDQSES